MLKPYRIRFDDDLKVYVFTTTNRVTYHITLFDRRELVQDYPHLKVRVLEFSFYPSKPQVRTNDPRVEVTIIHLLNDIFKKNENVLLVVYESTDGKHKARQILFEKWYKRNTTQLLEKVNFALHMPDLDIKGMFLFRKDHPQRDEILKVTKEIKDELQSYK